MSRLSATDPGRQKKSRLTPEMLDAWNDAATDDYFLMSYLKNVFISLWKTAAADQNEIITLIISTSCLY